MADFQRESKTRAWVSCPACSHEIPLASTPHMRGEFSVPCPNCGQRKMYLWAEAHDAKREAEVIKAAGAIQFATGRKRAMRPKSWLNAWLHSL